MGEALMMGIDAGTSHVRALVFEIDGTLMAEGSSEPHVTRPRPGWASTDAEELWQACLKAIRKAATKVKQPDRIRSIAVASVGESAAPIDKNGNSLYPMIAWYDCRTEPQAQWLKEQIGEEQLFERTGLNLYPIFGLCKQLWIRDNEPEVFRKVESWLNTADFLAWKLCGVRATDYSLASRTFGLDIRRLEYADDLLDQVGIPQSWYQTLVPSGTYLGRVLPEVSQYTGLDRGCVVSSGGHDHFVGALIAGSFKEGTLINSMGTAEAVTLFLEKPLSGKVFGKKGYAQGVIVLEKPYYYLVGGLFTSGGAVQWFHHLTEDRHTHKELIHAAEKLPVGSNGVLFLPHLRVGSPPNPAEISRGAFLGLGTDTDHAVLYRAMLEGMACDVRMIIEGMMHHPDIPTVKKIKCFGGESRNHLYMQIKASVMNRTLTKLDMTEAVSLGAAILGGIGAGTFRNLEEALASLNVGSETFKPSKSWSSLYQTHYDKIYNGAWNQIRPLTQRLLNVYPPARLDQ